MPRQERKNACHACTQAKRACDRRDPQCGRCAERMIDCRYAPQRIQRAENARLAPYPAQVHTREAQLRVITQPSASPSGPLTPCSWQQTDAALSFLLDLNANGTQALVGDLATGRPASQCVLPAAVDAAENFDPSWFLHPATWDVQRTYISVSALPSRLFKGYVKGIIGWLRDWTTHGHTSFIHPQLYRAGLPDCLQDAYTTVVAYLAKNEETEDMVFQILQNRATRLIQQSLLFEGVEILDMKAHLARTQALLMYTIMHLCSESPQQRQFGEEMFPTLREWCQQMWDVAAKETPLLYNTLTSHVVEDGAFDLGVWRAWVLSESIRRTWLVAITALIIYPTLKAVWVQCPGGVMFTARQGLWEAKSAPKWMREARNNGPIFVSCLKVADLVRIASPAEVDSFTHHLLTVVMTADEVEHWFAKFDQG